QAMPHLNLTSPEIKSINLSQPLFSWSRVDFAVLLTLGVLAARALARLKAIFCSRKKRVQSEVMRSRRVRPWCVDRLLLALLKWPAALCLLFSAALLTPSCWQLYSRFVTLTDGQLFDLDISSLRSVTGVLTDRYDALNWLASNRLLLASAPAASGAKRKLSPRPTDRSSWSRRLEGTRGITLYYSARGGREKERVVGNVLSLDALAQLHTIEASVLASVGEELIKIESVVPCLLGNLTSSSVADSPVLLPDLTSVRVCLSYVGSDEGQSQALDWHFSTSCGGDAAAGNASCPAIRSQLWLKASADFDKLIGAFEAMGSELVELSWYGDNWLFWREFNLNLRLDAALVVISLVTLVTIMIGALRLPVFATCSLLIVLMSLPIGLAVYTGPLQQEKLPILAVVTVYLILGIGVDAIFVFTNAFFAEWDRAAELRAMSPCLEAMPTQIFSLSSSRSSSAPHPLSTPPPSPCRHHMPPTPLEEEKSSPKGIPTAPHPREERQQEVDILARALRKATGVTGLCALTTAVAFGASVNSPISTIRQYAALQTGCVLANLLVILLVFVPFMVAFRASLVRSRARMERIERCAASCPPRLRAAYSLFSFAVQWLSIPLAIVIAPSTHAFWARFGRVIERSGKLMLIAWLAVLSVQLYFCSKLQPTNDAPSVFDESHNLERRVHLKRYAFGEQASSISDAIPGADLSEATLQWVNSAQGRECTRVCDLGLLGDGVCQPACDTENCCSDLGDCGYCSLPDGETFTPAAVSPVASPQPSIPPQPSITPPQPPINPLPLPPTAPPSTPSNSTASSPPPTSPSPLSLDSCTPATVAVTGSGALSAACSFKGECLASGSCECFHGYGGSSCEDPLDKYGNSLLLLPESHCATIELVWGVDAEPTRAFIDGRPISASLTAQPLTDESSQRLIAELCDYLHASPPWHVRPGSLKCPLRDLQQARELQGLSWPVPEDQLIPLLILMAQADDWALRSEAGWVEGLSHRHNAIAAQAGSSLRGWQTSSGWVWMEAIDEAVGGTAGCIASGALLTFSTLLLFTGSPSLALTTIGGVGVILICFVGYLTQRGYSLGVIEAVATTIFIGLACDYCVHVCQTHRSGDASLLHTLSHSGPSLYSAALTTASSATPLLLCRIVIFKQMGEFIIACTIISLAVAITLVAPAIDMLKKQQVPLDSLRPVDRRPNRDDT
ncbi:MAG: hypothetical protein SGPRY_001503, partial [Prymnesium sp.]